MTNYEQDWNIANIRSLLVHSFMDSSELRRFCEDRPDFQPFLDLVNPGASLQEHVDIMISYSRTRLLLAGLLAEMRIFNSPQYERFAPYRRGSPSSSDLYPRPIQIALASDHGRPKGTDCEKLARHILNGLLAYEPELAEQVLYSREGKSIEQLLSSQVSLMSLIRDYNLSRCQEITSVFLTELQAEIRETKHRLLVAQANHNQMGIEVSLDLRRRIAQHKAHLTILEFAQQILGSR